MTGWIYGQEIYHLVIEPTSDHSFWVKQLPFSQCPCREVAVGEPTGISSVQVVTALTILQQYHPRSEWSSNAFVALHDMLEQLSGEALGLKSQEPRL